MHHNTCIRQLRAIHPMPAKAAAAKVASTPRPTGTTAATASFPWASVAEVAATAAVAASTLSEASVATAGTDMQPVSAVAVLHVAANAADNTGGVTAIATAIAILKEPQLSASEVLDDKMIRLAAALRTKYRRGGGPCRIPVESVGFHPKNRDGQPPNGSRCAELFKDIYGVGFDAEESNNGGVVVEATPGSTVLHDFNKKACDGDPFNVPVLTGLISYGSLSHSHLHQCLRNIRGGGVCLVQEVSESGKFSLAKLKTADPAFGHAAETGLCWDILSYAIEV